MQIPTSSLSRACAALSALIGEQQQSAVQARQDGRPVEGLLAEIRRNEAARADLLVVVREQRADEREAQRIESYGRG